MREKFEGYKRQLAICHQRLSEKEQEIRKNEAEERKAKMNVMKARENLEKLQYVSIFYHIELFEKLSRIF